MTVWSFHTECVLKKQNLPLNCFLNLRNIPVGGRKRDKGFSFTSNGLRELAQLKFAATHVRDVVCKGQSLSGDLFSCSSPGCAKALGSLLKVCAVKTPAFFRLQDYIHKYMPKCTFQQPLCVV